MWPHHVHAFEGLHGTGVGWGGVRWWGLWGGGGGDAPTTSQWSTISLPTKVRLILEVGRYPYIASHAHFNEAMKTLHDNAVTRVLHILINVQLFSIDDL